MTAPLFAARTTAVPGLARAVYAGVFLLSLSAPVGPGPVAQGPSDSAKASDAWLTLEQDQRAERERAGAQSGSQATELRIREQRERSQLGTMLDTQRRERNTLERGESKRTREISPAAPSAAKSPSRHSLIKRQGLELDALRLQQKMRRQIDPAGGSRYGR